MLFKYNKVSKKVVEELKQICGDKNIIFDDKEKMEPYSRDEISEKGYTAMPEVVVKPGTAEEISRIMKLAGTRLIPVTPRGGGSGLSGGAVPIYGGILLSLERMNRIIEIDRENMMAVVEPGVVTSDINRALQKEGLFYAGYPMSRENCFIGGNVAENSGGARAVKYGVTRRYVLGLEVVLPSGKIIQLGGKRIKDVTGYDLLHLMIGSEGTLGIFTRIILRLLPLPSASAVLLAPFPNLPAAINAASGLLAKTGIIPSAVEFMDQTCVQASCRVLSDKVPFREEAESFLLIEVDGNPKAVEDEYNAVADFCLDEGALDVFVATTPVSKEQLWKVRERISESLKACYPAQTSEDIVVPPSAIPALINEAYLISSRHDLGCACFGHACDGNIHIHLLKKETMGQEDWEQACARTLELIYQKAKQLGGTLSGEHGIGHKRKKYIPLFLGKEELSLMQAVKKVFDPQNILNPGKIFDLD